jgi:Rad3-related DNA helicase
MNTPLSSQSTNRPQSPTPIQSEVLSNALRGRDILGNAPTGSGKTLAYLLPYLALLSHPNTLRATPGQGPSGIIVVPTRELVEQVYTLCTSIIPPYDAQYRSWLDYYAQCAVNARQYTPQYTHQSLMARKVLGLVGGTDSAKFSSGTDRSLQVSPRNLRSTFSVLAWIS